MNTLHEREAGIDAHDAPRARMREREQDTP